MKMKDTEISCDKLWYLLDYVIVLIAQAAQRDLKELNKQHVSRFLFPQQWLNFML